jgi:hypothetical protein
MWVCSILSHGETRFFACGVPARRTAPCESRSSPGFKNQKTPAVRWGFSGFRNVMTLCSVLTCDNPCTAGAGLGRRRRREAIASSARDPK